MRLLIVEDEDSIRSAMVRALIQAGHAVSAASSLGAARAILAELPADKAPQALLSDLKLPDGSGLELARELGLPFVLMSGFAGFDDAVAALRLGCVDFFTKPVAIKEIRRALGEVERRLGERRQAMPALIDPAGAIVRLGPDGPVAEPIAAQEAAWQAPTERIAAVARLWTGSSLRLRRVLAELALAAPAGRIVVDRTPARTAAWLPEGDAGDGDRMRILAALGAVHANAAGILVELPAEPAAAEQPGAIDDAGIASGELHWPMPVDGAIDLTGAVCIGSWLLPRLRGGLRLAGAAAGIAAELAAAGIAAAPSAPGGGRAGVGAAERAALFGP